MCVILSRAMIKSFLNTVDVHFTEASGGRKQGSFSLFASFQSLNVRKRHVSVRTLRI